MIKMRIKQKAITALFVLLAFPGPAWATISEYLSRAEGDPTFEMLGNLFGPVPGIIPGTPSPLSEMFVIFNMAVFSVAVLMVLYGVISGVMHTAVEGKFLGQRHSSIWYPIRVVYGIFGLVPIFAGWSFPQALMIISMVVGIGIGNITWDAGWKFMLGHVENLVLVNPEAAGKDDTIKAIIQAQLCTMGHNDSQHEDQEFSAVPALLFKEEGVAYTTNQAMGFNGIGISWGGSGAEYPPDACGGVRINKITLIPLSSSSGLLTKSKASAPPFDSESIIRAHEKALRNMSNSLLPLSKALYAAGTMPDPGALESIRLEYISSVGAELAKVASDSSSGFGEYMKDIGSSWLYAGAVFAKIVDVNRQVMSAAKITPEAVAPKFGNSPRTMTTSAAGGLNGLNLYAGYSEQVESSLNGDKLDIQNFISSTMGAGFVSSIMKAITWNSGEMLTSVINIGYTLLTATWTVYGVGMALAAKAEVLSGASIAGFGIGAPTAAITVALLTLAGLTLPLMIAGFIFAFYVPFIPTILWYGAVLSYGIILIEAVVGAPLWQLAYLETEGEGLGQKTAHGFMFLLNVLFRPVLMIIGLVSGWLLMNIMGQLLQFMIMILFGTSSYGFSGIASIFAFIAAICIFALLAYMTVSKCFSLIHYLPNEVLAFVGGYIGKIGGGEDDTIKNAVAGGTGAYAGSAQKGMRKGIGEAKSGLEKAKEAGKGNNPPPPPR